MADWINSDGLRVTNGTQGNQSGRMVTRSEPGPIQTISFDIGVDSTGMYLPFPGDYLLNGDTSQAYLCEGDVILRGWTIVEEVFVGATALTTGLIQADGTLITSTGLDVVVSLAAVGVTAMNGASIGTALAATAADPIYIFAAWSGAVPTAGKGRVVVQIIPNRVKRAVALISEAQ